jgi:GxxExxY protein
MNTDERGFFDSLTERVLGAVFEVSNTLSAGFLEKVYERALLRELGLRGIRATAQASFAITYKDHYVGEYFADILVEDVLVVELKCVERLANEPLLSNSFENHVGAVDRAAGGEDERAIQVELKLRHKQPERITHPWKEYAAFSVRFCVSSHAPYLKRPCANTKPRNTPRE